VAAVIKEFSFHLGNGATGILTTWSFYVLIGAGAASLLLASHALAAGPLAASQPGFTILDPLAASLLGLFLFGEHFQAGKLDLAAEALALALIVGGVSALSHSHLIVGEQDIRSVSEPAETGAIGPASLDSAGRPVRNPAGDESHAGQERPGTCPS
jgi:hypothetical protein